MCGLDGPVQCMARAEEEGRGVGALALPCRLAGFELISRESGMALWWKQVVRMVREGCSQW